MRVLDEGRQVHQRRQLRLRAQHLAHWARWAAARATRNAAREDAVVIGTAAVDRRRRRGVFDAWRMGIVVLAAGRGRALARSIRRWHAAAAAASSRRTVGLQIVRTWQGRVRRAVFAALVAHTDVSRALNRLYDNLVGFRRRLWLLRWRDGATHARAARARFHGRVVAADAHAAGRGRREVAARLGAWRAVVVHGKEARARFRVRVMAAAHYTATLQRAGLDAFVAESVARQLTVRQLLGLGPNPSPVPSLTWLPSLVLPAPSRWNGVVYPACTS